MLQISEIKRVLRESSTRLGLVYLGAVPLEGPENEAFGRFERWLAEGRHAGMGYLEANKALRHDPRALLAGARSAVVVGLPYGLGDRLHAVGGAPRVAQYARWRDYHKVLWRKGDELLADVLAACGEDGHVGRVVVDSAPVLERALAERTRRGFIGKNTCFIDPRRGSFLLLAEIVTTLPLDDADAEPIEPTRRTERGGCGTCRRCQVHCPTGALDDDYRIDANACLAYWTIEHRGTIPERFWPWLGTYWFGCDICQLVCPYNRKRERAPDTDGRLKLAELPALFDVATMTAEGYERMFGGTPMTRAKREGLVRNALVAMCVTKDPRLDEALRLLAELGTTGVVQETVEQIARWRAGQGASMN